MHDESSSKGIGAAFMAHREKLAVGVVLVAAVAFLGARFAAGPPVEQSAVEEMVRVGNDAENARNPAIPAPRSLHKSSGSPQIAAFRPPAFTAGPRIDRNPPDEKPQPDPIIFVMPIVKLESATPSFEGIELAGSLTEAKAEGLVRGRHVVDPKSFYFQIERRVKGDDWQIIASKVRTIEDRVLRYRDTGTRPKIDYEYRVTLGAEDSKWIAEHPEGLVSKPSETVAARTPSLFDFKLDNYQRFDEEDPPRPATVYITITKHDPVAGEVSIAFTHTEGQRIGWQEIEKGKWTSKHRVPSKKLNRTVEVDFNSGAVLRKVAAGIPVTYKYKECKIKHTKDGPICEETKETEGTYPVHEATLLDEDNKPVVIRKPSGAGPKGDRLCPEHGGRPPPAR